jgi:hypothetical protein
MCILLKCLKAGTSGRHFWIWDKFHGLHEMREICRVALRPSISQELYCRDLHIWGVFLVSVNWQKVDLRTAEPYFYVRDDAANTVIMTFSLNTWSLRYKLFVNNISSNITAQSHCCSSLQEICQKNELFRVKCLECPKCCFGRDREICGFVSFKVLLCKPSHHVCWDSLAKLVLNITDELYIRIL